EDLVITLSNGERITVRDHFAEHLDMSIEQIEFANGEVLNLEDIRNKSVADQKANGANTVIGSDFAETYTHALGDGTYRISDWDNNSRPDTLVFSDVNSDQLVLSRFGNDLRIILPNGEYILIDQQLGSNDDYYIETFEFADGITMSAADIAALVVAPETIAGDQIGTDADDAYSHAAGDGSYTITDYDYHRGADSLTFSDLNAADVTVGRIGNNVTLSLSNGEQITLVGQLNEDRRTSIETITFADGSSWTQDDLRNQLVDDMKASGTVIGTENDEAYTHALGDGSYTISDYDYHRGADSLAFSDANASDVTLSRSGNDLIFTLSNGEQITVLSQLD
ncbi:calcium-binding protein, partial [Phaeobacter sp. B1627]|uniref:calcium-binding protein n=1 Tax=Phaeobacter sp. B1627 TaxID=2583809 RepID=UPI0011180391